MLHSKTGTALLLLCSAALLLALYLASRYHTPDETTPPPAPAENSPTPATAPESPKQTANPAIPNLSIEQHLEAAAPFGDAPDLFSDQTDDLPPADNTLFNTLNSPHKDPAPYSISGKLLLEDAPDYSLKSIEGLQLEVQIQTD